MTYDPHGHNEKDYTAGWEDAMETIEDENADISFRVHKLVRQRGIVVQKCNSRGKKTEIYRGKNIEHAYETILDNLEINYELSGF